jgi:hypothetical protein
MPPQVKETWTSYTLDLVNYQNKTRLIRGWDDLFLKCSENLSSLSSMKLSPYYKVFEEDAAAWEERLNRIHLLFNVWIDVQRQWVYLEFVYLRFLLSYCKTDRIELAEVYSREVQISSTFSLLKVNGLVT